MLDIQIRRGITNAKFNEKNSNILHGEILLLAIALGYGYESWWIFGFVFLGLCIGIHIPKIALFIVILFTIAWVFIGYGIGELFKSFSASIVLAVIGFFIGLGIHLSALEWIQDIDSIGKPEAKSTDHNGSNKCEDV